MAIVPIKSKQEKGNDTMKWLPPAQCFFGGGGKASFHSKLFVYVDFGAAANSFLSACGTKHEPSVEQVVLMLLADPHKFYNLAGSPAS